MRVGIWLATAVMVAATSGTALAQAASPVAPRTGTSQAGLDGKVAVVNSAKMMQGITEIRVKLESVNAKFDPRAKQLEAQQTQLQQMQNDIKSKQNVVPPDAFQKMISDYQDREKVYKRSAQDLQEEYNRELATALAPVEKKVGDFRKGYASARGISVILNAQGLDQNGALWFLAESIDITDDFISEYNKANPVPGASAGPARPAGSR